MTDKAMRGVLVMILVGGCTGQTGEEEPSPDCRDEPMPVMTNDPTPLGIVPADYFKKLDGSTTLRPNWGNSAWQAESVRFTIGPLDSARYVVSHPDGDTGKSACLDHMVLDVMLEFSTVESPSFSERRSTAVRVYGDRTGRIDAIIPLDSLEGTFDARKFNTSWDSYERLSVQLQVDDGAIVSFQINVDSDVENRTTGFVAAWP